LIAFLQAGKLRLKMQFSPQKNQPFQNKGLEHELHLYEMHQKPKLMQSNFSDKLGLSASSVQLFFS
jgi:hypothetical protein